MQGTAVIMNELDPITGSYPYQTPDGPSTIDSQQILQETLQNLPCAKLKGLSKGQAQLCQLYKDHIPHIGRGARDGISECQWQFKTSRWNCSTVDNSTVFGQVLTRGNFTITSFFVVPVIIYEPLSAKFQFPFELLHPLV